MTTTATITNHLVTCLESNAALRSWARTVSGDATFGFHSTIPGSGTVATVAGFADQTSITLSTGISGATVAERLELISGITWTPTGGAAVTVTATAVTGTTVITITAPTALHTAGNYAVTYRAISTATPRGINLILSGRDEVQGWLYYRGIMKPLSLVVSYPTITPSQGYGTGWKDRLQYAIRGFVFGIGSDLLTNVQPFADKVRQAVETYATWHFTQDDPIGFHMMLPPDDNLCYFSINCWTDRQFTVTE